MHCARHIFAHWHKDYKGDEMKMKMIFWKAAKAYNMVEYNEVLEETGAQNPAAVEAFRRYNPKVLCRAYMDTSTKVDVIVNNLAETFNGYIIQARTKHLIYMLEEIRTALMQRLVLKKQDMEKNVSQVCPRIQAKLEKAKKQAAMCNPIPSTATVFQVSHQMDTYCVDLDARSCNCRKWDLTGIPYCHAIACLFLYHYKVEDFVSDWYKRDTYLKSYNNSIPPYVGERD